MADSFIDHYLVLGLPTGEEGANLDEREITKAFKLRALKLHPDKRPRNETQKANMEFQQLRESYILLSDAEKRRDFDAVLSLSSFRRAPPLRRQAPPRRRQEPRPRRQAPRPRRKAPPPPDMPPKHMPKANSPKPDPEYTAEEAKAPPPRRQEPPPHMPPKPMPKPNCSWREPDAEYYAEEARKWREKGDEELARIIEEMGRRKQPKEAAGNKRKSVFSHDDYLRVCRPNRCTKQLDDLGQFCASLGLSAR